MTVLFCASWVLPVTRPAIRDGAIAVAGDRVTWVGRADDRDAPSGERRHLGPGVLLPGLVNAHCHLELSHLHGKLDCARGFVAWVEDLVTRRAAADRSEVRAAAAAAIRQVAESGTAAVGDVSNALDHLDLVAASGLSAVVFQELLGWDPARAGTILAEADERRAAAPTQGRVRVELAAHAPHSVSPTLFHELARRGGPAALHLAESPAEAHFLLTGDGEWQAFLDRRGLRHVAFSPPGDSPVRYADSLRALHRRLVAAHCVQVDAVDAEVLARRGVHVALCPRSNRNLGVGIAPVRQLIEAEVKLCLGTDSLASVDGLELIDDVALLHREHPRLAPAAIVAMATRGGAAALGFGDLGALAPGFRAALAYASADRPPADPLEFLVSGDARPRTVRS